MISGNSMIAKLTTKQGSPGWFREKAKTVKYVEIIEKAENLRVKFKKRFSPDVLANMKSDELLHDVFGENDNSMVNLLMYNYSYNCFGAIASRRDLMGVYPCGQDKWRFFGTGATTFYGEKKAKGKADSVRNEIIRCTNEIERIGAFERGNDYNSFGKKISDVFFFNHQWILKYFQMIYPDCFPIVYSKEEISRYLYVLGIKGYAEKNRIANAGMLALFIRQCDINNIVFTDIFENEWTKENRWKKCQNAKENKRIVQLNPGEPNQWLYGVNAVVDAKKRHESISEANMIDNEINNLELNGEEKEAVVKVRVNQGLFRERLLERYNACCLCGVSNHFLLIASHIKPWKDSNSYEKLDSDNGLLLCPNHDKLFDKWLISFDDTGRIMISKDISKEDQALLGINDDCRINVNIRQREYLNYHRKKFLFNRSDT